MSILTSASSAFTLNAKSHGLFSSHTAFKKPTFNTHFNKTANDCNNRLSTFVHPKDLATKQLNTVKFVVDIEDPEIIMCEPVKKVKLTQGKSAFSVPMNNKTQVNPEKSSRLTIEEVFNTPFDSKRPRKNSLGVDCFDEGSSLSFISSHSSFDNLDEETSDCVNRKNSDCIITGHNDMQSLVVKDNVVGRLSYLNQGPMLFNNLESHAMFFPLSNQACGYLGTLPLEAKAPLCMPANSLNEYVQFNMLGNNQETLQLGLNFSDKTINELVKNSTIEEGYDSDSYATRSTSVEQEAGEVSDKSQKGASPVYSGNEELYTEDRVKAQIKKTAQRVRKQAHNNAKEKKGRLLNLKLDLNPKQLKVQRRLNKLQLLRYQQGANEEEDEELKKFGVFDLLSRGNSTIQECDQETNNTADYETTPCDTLAVIPVFGEDSGRRKVKAVWTPEIIEEEKLENFLKQLEEVLGNPVSDIEAAIRLLKSYGMDMSLTLEAVKENVALYGEVFRLKVKRLRRRGA